MTEENKYLQARLSRGDAEAFAVIFNKYYGKVVRFVTSVVKDSAAAQDIAQDVFVKLWSGRSALEKLRSLDDWLFILSRNAALDSLKSPRSRQAPLSDDGNEIPSEETGADVLADINIRQEEIRTFVSGMPARRREIFSLSRYQGLSNDEIAEKMGVSKKTVENQLYLACRAIRNFYDKFLGIFFF